MRYTLSRTNELAEATGKSRSELKYRAQFAERYPTEDEVSNALETFPSWRQVRQNQRWPTEDEVCRALQTYQESVEASHC